MFWVVFVGFLIVCLFVFGVLVFWVFLGGSFWLVFFLVVSGSGLIGDFGGWSRLGGVVTFCLFGFICIIFYSSL